MIRHWRTVAYLLAAAIIWFAEDFAFSRGLGFNAAQTAVVTIYFLVLFVGAVWFICRTHARLSASTTPDEHLSVARVVSMAPVVTVLLGSFAALPVIVLVLLLGTIL